MSAFFFQCSSASRKFLNALLAALAALQRALSVLFSEPKIPQQRFGGLRCARSGLSVLFSEPKIPQLVNVERARLRTTFQCSSASRKFLNGTAPAAPGLLRDFQCSSASRKFLNGYGFGTVGGASTFSALQRAENSSNRPSHLRPSIFPTAMITLRHS